MTSSLAEALAQVQTQLPEIAKSRTAKVQTRDGSAFSYDYADLAEVSKQILPLLGGAGLSWICKPMLTEEGRFVLEYKLMHTSGDSEEGRYPLPETGTPQQIGSAITYARRYTLCSVTGVAPEQDDDDGAAASAKDSPKTAQRRVRTPQTQQTQQTPQRTAQRAPIAPPLPGDDAPVEQNGAPNPRTDRQSTLIHTLFTNIDWGDRDDKLRAVRAIIGRQLESTKELTTAEASKLIDELEPVAKADNPQEAMLDLLTRHEQDTVDAELVDEPA